VITFATAVLPEQAWAFEDASAIRLSSPERKQQLIAAGVGVWMRIDDTLAGEAYGAPARYAQDPDIAAYASEEKTMCCFGVALYDRFRGRGLGTLLVAYWNALVRAHGYTAIVGHAAHPAMLAIVKKLGAQILAVRHNWGGHGMTAYLYRMAP
jgi:GNAT superfamily N-acetyltransferase